MYRFLVLVLWPILFSAQTKKYPSLLWKITGKGLTKPSYVYGTMHVSNRVAYHLSDQFFEALKSVDVVGLETNPGEWLQNMEKYGDLEQFANMEMNRSMYNFYENAFNLNIPESKVYNNLLSYDAAIINGLLFRNNSNRENFEESTYIDLFIFQVASKLSKQVISLEDFGVSDLKARLAAVPDKKGDEEQESYKYKNYKDLYLIGEKIEDAYRKGDLTALDSLTQISDSKNMIKYLLEDRNVFFVNTIDSVLKTKTLFSGVGAAHLAGKNGVIELLRQRGYTVEPVMPKISKKADDEKEAFDRQFKSVKFIKQGSADSVISLNTPGRLFTLAKTSLITYQLCADMVNGNFYTLTTFKTFGALQNLNDESILKKIDSLLFENIPGKIISKEKLNAGNGIKGIDVITKTKKGDVQRYHIYAYNDILYIIKLGGKGDYAQGSDSKQFFNSIQFRSVNGLYENVFTPPNGGFEVKLPAVPSYQKNKRPFQVSLIEDLNVYDKSITGYIGVKHATYNDFNYLEEDSFELNVLARNTLKNFNCEDNQKRELKKGSKYPCIQLSGKTKDGLYFSGEIYINGIHYYLMYAFGKQPMPFSNPFFQSFKITDFIYTSPIKNITDDDFHFKVKDEVSVGLKVTMDSLFAVEYKKLNDSIDKPKNKGYDYYSSSKNYYSPSSTEYVRIDYEKYNDYEFRAKQDIKKQAIENLNPDKTLVVNQLKYEDTKDGFLINCVLKDTATQRAIITKVILAKDRIYRLSVPIDTVYGMRGWARGFYESFEPKDTLLGKAVTENKFKTLVNDIFSSDTTKRNPANYSFQNAVGTEKAYLDEYLTLLNRPDFNTLPSETRAQALVNCGILESDKVIEPLRKLYAQYEDSAFLQICIIKGLAYVKSKAANAAILQMLTTEPPLVGDENTISNVFEVFYDSLSLTKSFFPSLLALTRFDEYKQPVVKLLSTLCSEGLISSSDYASQKDNVLMEAGFELKRYNASQNKDARNYNYQSEEEIAKQMADELATSLYNTYSSGASKASASDVSKFQRNNYPYLVHLSSVLAPFYKQDEKVKLFFGKLGRVKNASVTLPVFVKLLKQSVVWNDTMNTYFSKQATTANLYYNLLEEERLEKQFDKNYYSQEHLAKSLLISELKLENANNYQTTRFNADSLQLIKKLEVKNKYDKGKLFVYRVRSLKGDGEKWHTVFVPETKKGITTKIQVINLNIVIEKTKTTAYYEDEILQAFQSRHRNRASYGDYYEY
jgi:uncharacterized protein YbaP (TraB family)